MSAGANPHPTDIAPVRAIGLQVAHLSKSFGSLKALDDVSIEVPAGSFHALLGENGAGKSTLVKCIMGYHRPDQGQLLVDGRKVRIDEIDIGSKARPMLEQWRLCTECSHMRREHAGEPPEPHCPRCKHPAWPDAGQSRTLIHFRRSRSKAAISSSSA